MTRRFAFVVLLAVSACSRQPAVNAPPESRAERLAAIGRITAACQVPATMMRLIGEDRLELRPALNEDYNRVECVLRRLDELNLPAGNVDFVGNTAGPPPELNEAVARGNAATAEGDNAQAH